MTVDFGDGYGRPLRIALLSHQVGRNDGQGRVNYEIAIAALARDFEVTILSVRCAPELAQHPRVRLIVIDNERVPTQLLRNVAFAFQSATWLKKNRHTLDIVQVNGFITWAASDVNVAHFVHKAWARSRYYPFHMWWRSGYFAYQRLFTVLNVLWERKAFNCAKAVVAVSGRVARELEDIEVPSEKILVIHNGVDTEEFHPGSSERAHFRLPLDVPLFLFAGDIRTPRKNLETVLNAIHGSPGLHLAVAGNVQGSPYPLMAHQLGISDRVYFLGMVAEMPLLMRSVDGLIFPSRYDPFGLVVLEAMASGVPVVTSRTAGGSELLGEGGRILEDPDDGEVLSAWLHEIAADKSLRIRMGRKGRAIALSNTWSRMAKQYLDLYEELFERNKASVAYTSAT
jgi:glycosyltransferase involved in cell wall biosynthesis